MQVSYSAIIKHVKIKGSHRQVGMSIKLGKQQRIREHHGTRRKRDQGKISSPKNWRNLRGKSDWVRFDKLLPSRGSPKQECLLSRMQISVHQVRVRSCYLFSHRPAFLGLSWVLFTWPYHPHPWFLVSPRSKVRTKAGLEHIHYVRKGQGIICNYCSSTVRWKHLAYTF